jgi:hypothetical protein
VGARGVPLRRYVPGGGGAGSLAAEHWAAAEARLVGAVLGAVDA